MIKKLVLMSLCLLFGVLTAAAQKRVTGKVLDEEGQPVIGANVRVDESKLVTVTDADGKFSFPSVPNTAKKLNVTYIGMESNSADVAGNVNIVLKQNDRILDEAVVVGYGTAKKLGTVVGSVKKVGSEVINGSPVINVADVLQGQVSGMSVLNSNGDAGTLNNTSITIRGKGSLSGNNPLIVVDGSPTTSSVFSMINNEDIESITTLKDASATSIYGSRAANGVIYITTKKGRRNEKAQIRVAQKVGWSQLARPINSNLPSASELLDFQFANGIIDIDKYEEFKAHGANTDWQAYFFDNAAPLYTTDFSIRGGSEKTSYFVSASYNDQEGVVEQSGMKRYTLRTNLDSKPKNWLQFGINQSITYTDRQNNRFTDPGSGEGMDFQNATVIYPSYFDPYDPESQKEHMIWGMEQYSPKYLLSLAPFKLNDIVYNGTAFLQLTPLKGLTLKSQLSLYAGDTRGSSIILPGFPGTETSGGSATESHDRWGMWTITNTAEYKFNIGEANKFTLLAGQEGIRFDNKNFNVSTQGITDNRLTLLGNGTEISGFPESGTAAYRYLSFFGRLDYSLYDRYYANFTVRSDASSRFGSDNRSAMFYSGGLMWNAKNERFLRSVKWLSALQLKASVGSTGNSDIGNYAHLGLVGTSIYGGQNGWMVAQPSNPNLGWEKQVQTNAGFNVSFLNKLHVDFNFYHRKTKDMLMAMPLPYTTGFSAQQINVGEMSNRGVELEINYDVFRTRKAYLSLRATYSYNDNRIDKLFYDIQKWPKLDELTSYNVGQSLNYYMPIFAGVDKEDGAAMWYKVGHKGGVKHAYNPETMTKDYNQIDNLYQDTGIKRDAPHNGGFGLTAGWNGLTLSADFTFVLKKYMVNQTRFWTVSAVNAIRGNNVDKEMFSMWQKPGDITNVPAFNENNFQFDTRYLENASFLRLKNLTLAYDIPLKDAAKRYISNVRLNFTGRNLFTVTEYRGADPEINLNIASGGVPSTRQYVLGVELLF